MVLYRYFNPNEVGRDFVCGDIHGCFSDLEIELKKVNFNKSIDRLFTVGDLTDRGPESEKAFKYIDYDWFFSIKGNHEEMLILYLQRLFSKSSFYHNGGDWTSEVSKEDLCKYKTKINDLPYIIQVGNFGIIHSRLPESMSWNFAITQLEKEEVKDIILWERNNYRSIHDGIEKIYAGHTIQKEPKIFGNLEIIDTGAFLKYWDGYSGYLTLKEIGK